MAVTQRSGRHSSTAMAHLTFWLGEIRDHIATSLQISAADLDYTPFVERGGVGKAYEVFGEQLAPLLEELTEVLAA